jgi:hypothetical protein
VRLFALGWHLSATEHELGAQDDVRDDWCEDVPGEQDTNACVPHVNNAPSIIGLADAFLNEA